MRRRSDEEFDTFWQETVRKCTKLQLSQPQLPEHADLLKGTTTLVMNQQHSGPQQKNFTERFTTDEFIDNSIGEISKQCTYMYKATHAWSCDQQI